MILAYFFVFVVRAGLGYLVSLLPGMTPDRVRWLLDEPYNWAQGATALVIHLVEKVSNRWTR